MDKEIIRYFEQKMAAVPVDPFLAACFEGRINDAERLLDDGHDVDHIQREKPELTDAEIYSHIDEYIEARKKFPLLDCVGKAAIHIAMEMKNEPLLRLLGSRSANLFLRDETSRKNNPLQIGIRNGFIAGVRYLTDEMYVLEIWPENETPLENILVDAVESPDPDNAVSLLRFLVEEKHVDWHKARSVTNLDLLQCSELRSTGRVTDYLLTLGWNLNEDSGPVVWLDDNSDKEFAQSLSDKFGNTAGSFLDRIQAAKQFDDLYGGTPLNRVTCEEDMARVRLYLEHRADPWCPNRHGMTAIDAGMAVYEKEVDRLERWTQRGMEESSLRAQRQRVKLIADIVREMVHASISEAGPFMPPPAASGPG
jgi:hypothetical protein